MLFYIVFFFFFISLTSSSPVYLSEQSTTQPTQEECLEYLVGNATNVAREQLFRDKKALDAKDEKILETFGKSVRGVHRKMGVNDLSTLTYALYRISEYYESEKKQKMEQNEQKGAGGGDKAQPAGEKVTEAPPTEGVVVEAPPAGEKVTEAPPTEGVVVEAPPAGEKVTEAPPTEGVVVEAPPAGEKVTEAPPTEGVVVEAPPAGEKVTEAPPTEGAPSIENGEPGVTPAVNASQKAKTTDSNEATNEPEVTNTPTVTTANTTNSSSATAVEVTRKKREASDAQPTGIENPEEKGKNGAITEQSVETKKEYIEKPREPREDVITKLYMLILNDFYPKEQTEDKAQFLSVMTLLFKDAYRLEQHIAVEHSLRNYYMQLKMALLD